MKIESRPNSQPGFRGFCSRHAFHGAILGLLLFAAPHLSAQSQGDSKDQISFGFSLGKSATPKDVGLPWYPGAQRHKDDPDDSSSVQLSFNSGSSDFKLAVLKLDSPDSPEKVAAFYRQALSKYGKILECTASTKTSEKHDDSKTSLKLTCDSDKPKNGGLELKSGTGHDQHIVGVESSGAGTLIQLVYIKLPKDVDKD